MKKWLLALLFSTAATANTYMSDMSDLWWNANESGWGVTVTHQRDTAFLTFFVYDSTGRPYWITSTATYAGRSAQNAYIFSGAAYQTNGPYFGAVFNPASVSLRQVGTVTFTSFLDGATLVYSIDGVTVTKQLTRQTFRNNDLSGNFSGAIQQTQSACRVGIPNGTFNQFVNATISLNGSSFVMLVRQTDNSTCTYTGAYTQSGRLGSVRGTHSCTGSIQGTFSVFDVEATLSSVSGRFTAVDNGCSTISGKFSVLNLN